MDSVEVHIQTFLTSLEWQDAARESLAGDMSARRYERLRRGDDSLVLMISDADIADFVTMTNWLRGLGCSAPEIRAVDPGARLIALEDFGDVSVRSLLSDPSNRTMLFELVIELLLQVRAGVNAHLPCPTADQLVDWTLIADAHYPEVDPDGLRGFRAILQKQLTDALKTPTTVSLRDFHSDNLMWLPERTGPNRLGLLDYQDAFLTHPAYDLMSFLTDARTPISAEERDDAVEHYLQRSGDDSESFKAAFFALSAQRNLRILGIFARAGKHLDKLPLVHRYFRQAVEHPMFDDVRDEVLAAVPPPERQLA